MSKAHKALLAIFGIPLVLLIITTLIWDANWFKSDVETQLADLENHTITFDNIEHSLLSPGKLTVNDIKVTGGIANGQVASVSLDIDVMPALHKKIIVRQITLNDALINIDMQALEAYQQANAEAPQQEDPPNTEPLPIEIFFIKSILLRNISVSDVSAGQLFSAKNINLEMSDINLIADHKVVVMQNEQAINIGFFVEELMTKQIPVGKISGTASVKHSLFDISSLELESTNSKLSLSGLVKDPKNIADLSLSLNDSYIDVADFAPLLGKLPVLPSGKFHFAGNLATQGELGSTKQLLQALTGDIDLQLSNGALQGIDLNKLVTAIKDSKKTSLRDIGGFLISGPIGLIASNMFDLGGGASAFDGTTQIPQLHVQSHFDKGKLQLKDTAIATDKNRLAFTGAIDLANQKFNDFTFALLDNKGCAEVKQTLNGDIDKPASAVSKSLLDTAISPITDLLGKVTKSLGKECQPFYEGDVSHPNGN